MILCITHSQDFYNIDLFFARLASRGIPYFRLDSDRLNHQQAISITGDGFELTDGSGTTVTSGQITAVWHRKSWPIAVPEEMDENYRPVFLKEYSALRHNMFTALQHLPWINPFEAEAKIDGNKMLQLKLAKKHGLRTPETLFSNDPDRVTAFFHQKCNGRMIGKLHGALTKSMAGENFLSTHIIDRDSLENIEDIAYCPMIFQPYIEKAYELRIIYVDGSFFTGKINNSEHTDWRISREGYFWSAYELPQPLKESLAAMMQEMNLYLGAIDMIKGRDGEYYFLEINPQGEWGMLQKDLDFPVAQRIADHLIKRMKTHE